MATGVRLDIALASILVFAASVESTNFFEIFAKTTSHRNRGAVESTVLRYLREVGEDSNVVHLIVDSAQDGTDRTRETIVRTCSNFGAPLTILLSDESTENRAPRIVKASYPKFRHVLAIYRGTERLKPARLREAYKRAWKSGGFFGIFVEGETIDEGSAEALLKSFWEIDCSNVVLIDLGSSLSSSGSPKIYGYHPFHNVAKDPNRTLYEVSSTDRLFPAKLHDLRGHRIPISLYPNRPSASLPRGGDLSAASGTDVELLRYASRRLNFTIDLRTRDVDAVSYSTRLPNGRRIGPIGDVIAGTSEYLANSQFLESLDAESADLDFVYPYWRSHSIVVVRRARPLPAFFYIIRSTETTHVLYVGIFAIFVFFLYRKIVKNCDNFLLTILGLVLFQHLRKIGAQISDRIFSFALLYGSFVICIVCQGYLVNDLTALPIYPSADTLAQLAKDAALRSLMVRPYELRILRREASDESKRRLAMIARVEYNFSRCMSLLRKTRSVACTIDASYGKFSLASARRCELERAPPTVGKEEPPMMHVVKESLMNFWQSYVVRKGFPHLDGLDESFARAFEFGLVEKWIRDDKGRRFNEPPVSKEPATLSLYHLDYTFAVLLIGDALAVVVFILEIVLARERTRRFILRIRRGFRRAITEVVEI